MGIFKRNKSIPADMAKHAKKDAPEAVEEQVIQAVSTKVTRADILPVSPRVSEKSAFLAARGKYAFDVPLKATKPEVRKSVKLAYGVDVLDVNMLRGIGKEVRRGRTVGRRNRWKKAIVTVKPGQKIDLFVGV
jgi:large subunit ribosomal protein L23